MEVVTLAQFTFNRIGSASRFGASMHREVKRTSEVADVQPETLRAETVRLVIELGEDEGALSRLAYEGVHYDHGSKPGMVFNVHGPNTVYGSPYVTCRAFPAMKSGTRYFEVVEVST